jgi:hypothetical protein
MTTHRYDPRTLAPDYARAAAGLFICMGSLIWSRPGAWLGLALTALAGLFVAFAWRTLRQHFTEVEVDGAYLRWRAFRQDCIAWKDLQLVALRHYSTRRDRSGGWMQLTLRGGGRRISIDSTIEGFPTLLARVMAEARAAGIAMGDRTLANAEALIGAGAAQRQSEAP